MSLNSTPAIDAAYSAGVAGPGEYGSPRRFALGAADAGGGVLSLANPEGRDVYITRLILNVGTKTAGACTIDAGVGADKATKYDNLIDGLDVNAASGVFCNGKDGGTNGKMGQLWKKDQFLTASKATGAAAGLAGYAFVEYVLI